MLPFLYLQGLLQYPLPMFNAGFGNTLKILSNTFAYSVEEFEFQRLVPFPVEFFQCSNQSYLPYPPSLMALPPIAT